MGLDDATNVHIYVHVSEKFVWREYKGVGW